MKSSWSLVYSCAHRCHLCSRVGSATIGEVLAALAEVLYGSQFGLGALLSGLVQGLGSEFGFIVTKNRYESWLSLTANSIGDYAC